MGSGLWTLALLSAMMAGTFGCARTEGERDDEAAPPMARSTEFRNGEAPMPRRVAITFDDLPATNTIGGNCDHAAILALNRRLLEAVDGYDVTATGLVSEGGVCAELRPALPKEVYSMWLDGGHTLGNHTFSHRDIDTVPIEFYLADIEQGEETVRGVLDGRGDMLRYFRPPLLHTGDDSTTRQALFQYLDQHRYTMAPVTIDNQEWVFEAVYLRAKQRGDSAMMERVSGAYVPYLEDVMQYFEGWSEEVVGYEPPQVLLLHANEINSDHFGAVAEMLESRGYTFISLDEALADPAYRLDDGYIGPRGLSWVHRWALGKGMEIQVEEPREPAWLADLFESYP